MYDVIRIKNVTEDFLFTNDAPMALQRLHDVPKMCPIGVKSHTPKTALVEDS